MPKSSELGLRVTARVEARDDMEREAKEQAEPYTRNCEGRFFQHDRSGEAE